MVIFNVQIDNKTSFINHYFYISSFFVIFRVLREQKSLVEEDLQLAASQLKSVGEKDIKIAELRQELNNTKKVCLQLLFYCCHDT